MAFLLALDQGTTSSRAILFDDTLGVVAIAQREFQQHYPQPGWVEHDAQEIWDSQLAVAVEVLEKAGRKPADLAALGITNQRETIVVWDRATGVPIHPAIVWQDRRTAATCGALRASGEEAAIREKTGLLLDPYFSATKIAWILDHVSGARAAAEAGRLACGTIDTWLISKLTGGAVHATDFSNASRTSLMNLHTGQWDDELLATFRVPRKMLPEIRESSAEFGTVASSLPLAGALIGGVAGDQQSALFGQGCFSPGDTKNTYGTGCFMLMNTGAKPVESANRLLTTGAWRVKGATEYALEGSVFTGGAVVSWLRDGLGLVRSSAEFESLANSAPDSGGVYLVPAFTGLGAPHWDPYARGTLVGITRGTTAAHIARAALDSIAFQVADLFDAMRADLGGELAALRVDGGAAVNNALLQRQADILQISILRPKITETTALGAACLAGLAAGVWASAEEISQRWQLDRQFDPQAPADEIAAQRARWNKAVERAKDWAEET